MKIKHVIVDGSNIATEGRDAPSLAQLDEAVQAFVEQYSPDHVTVVVDATFPNRIDRKERQTYEDAVNANELITPPAGAIGRGDAFVLQIARRAGASILSNDSFQEFHGEYPWLFERGRLFGGKPVPHVGWVFMERAPVRGPTSRRAVSEARKVAKAGKVAPAAAELAEEAAEVAAPDGADATEGVADKPARRRRSRAAAKEPQPARGPRPKSPRRCRQPRPSPRWRRSRTGRRTRRAGRSIPTTRPCRSSSSWAGTRWAARSTPPSSASAPTAPTCWWERRGPTSRCATWRSPPHAAPRASCG